MTVAAELTVQTSRIERALDVRPHPVAAPDLVGAHRPLVAVGGDKSGIRDAT